MLPLERISDGEVQALAFGEAREVEISALGVIARVVYDEAPVNSQDEEIKIVSDTHTCTYGKVCEELACIKSLPYSIAKNVIFERFPCLAECPYITGINKESAIERTEQTRAVFKIENAFQVTHV